MWLLCIVGKLASWSRWDLSTNISKEKEGIISGRVGGGGVVIEGASGMGWEKMKRQN